MRAWRIILIAVGAFQFSACSEKAEEDHNLFPFPTNARRVEDVEWGYINSKGKWSIAARFESAGDFSDGMALVRELEGFLTRTSVFGFIDFTGSVKINLSPAYSPKTLEDWQKNAERMPKYFSHGIAFIWFKDAGWKGVRKDGSIALRGPYADVVPFVRGIAAVVTDGKWSLIDATGRELSAKRFLSVKISAEGVLTLEDEKGFYLADVSTPDSDPGYRFEWLGVSTAGLTPMRSKANYGFIDLEGRVSIEPAWQAVGKFQENTGFVCVATGQWRFIDRSGRYVNESVFHSISASSDGYFLAETDSSQAICFNSSLRELGRMRKPPDTSGQMLAGGIVRFISMRSAAYYFSDGRLIRDSAND